MTDLPDRQLTDTPKKDESFEAQVLRARSYGLGRNQTADFLNVSTYQVDKASKELGIDWGGEHVAVANQARSEQAKKTRLDIAEKLRRVANLELDSILAGMSSPDDRRQMMTVVGIAVDKELKISETLGETAESADQAQAMDALERFMYSVKARAIDMPDQPGDH